MRGLLALTAVIAATLLIGSNAVTAQEDVESADRSLVESESAAFAALFAIPSESHSRHPRTSVLEYSQKAGMLSVLAESAIPHRHPSILHQMSADITVNELLNSNFPKTVLKRSSLRPNPLKRSESACRIMNDEQEVIEGTMTLSSLLTSNPEGIKFSCRVTHPTLESHTTHDSRAVYTFRSFASLFPSVLKEEKQIADLMASLRKQAEEGTLTSPSAEELEYNKEMNEGTATDRSFMESISTIGSGTTVNMKFPPEKATPAVAALYPTKSVDYHSNAQWGAEIYLAAQMTGKIRAYPTWAQHQLSGRFRAVDGAALNSGELPPVNANPVRFALASDWASSTVESDYVGQLMATEGGKPHWTLGAGDVYWTGTEANIRTSCLGATSLFSKRGVLWPKGLRGSFATLGNHEMYARGDPWFNLYQPTLGTTKVKQQAPYVSLETDKWKVLLLDTGFSAYDKWGTNQPPEGTDLQPAIYAWLRAEVRLDAPDDKRGILIITHHQPNSAFESAYVNAAKGLANIMPNGRKFVWLYGHEHKLSFYDLSTVQSKDGTKSVSYYGRCVGNGGYPTNVVPNAGPVSPPGSGALLGYDARIYQTLPDAVDPDLLNDDLGFKKTFNGWVDINIDGGGTLTLSYRTLKLDGGYATNTGSTEFARESYTVDANGNVVQSGALKFNYASQPVKVLTTRTPDLRSRLREGGRPVKIIGESTLDKSWYDKLKEKVFGKSL